MSLLPESFDENANDPVIIETPMMPSKTYSLDFDTGKLGGLIDGERAIRQCIHKALITNLKRPLIYDGTYGSELDTLIGSSHSVEYLETEIPRMVKDALIYDDRIADVRGITVSMDEDKMFVSFSVTLTNGAMLQIAEVVDR